MSDWKQSKHEAGTEVIVHDIENKYLGIGTLVNSYDSESEDWEILEIKMSDGSIIFGYECWWIPVNEIPKEYRPGGSKWKGD